MRSKRTSVGARTPHPRASSYYYPPAQAALVVHKHLDEMTPIEAVSYTEQLIERLRNKQDRERAYLDGRARRGIRRSTDELYEQDQALENEILAVFAEILEGMQEKAANINKSTAASAEGA